MGSQKNLAIFRFFDDLIAINDGNKFENVKIFRAYNFIIKSITRSFIIFKALLKTM